VSLKVLWRIPCDPLMGLSLLLPLMKSLKTNRTADLRFARRTFLDVSQTEAEAGCRDLANVKGDPGDVRIG